VAINAGAGNVIVGSDGLTLQEDNRTSGTGYFRTFLVLPDEMATSRFAVTVTVGALSVSASDRAVGGGCTNAAGTKAIFVMVPQASGFASIRTWDGTTLTNRVTVTAVAVPGDKITIQPSVSSGVVTWTALKNGTPIAGLAWSDSTHVLDLPGTRPAPYFTHAYSFGDFHTRGIAALSAVLV